MVKESKKCYHPHVKAFTKDNACKTSHIKEDGTVVCMLGSIIWKIKNNKMGWHCDWEKKKIKYGN